MSKEIVPAPPTRYLGVIEDDFDKDPVSTKKARGFKPGYDPNRNCFGNTGAKTTKFRSTFRGMLVEYGLKEELVYDRITGEMVNKPQIELVVQALYERAKLGDVGAIQVILERVEGKVTQPIELPKDTRVLVLSGNVNMEDL